MDIGIILFILLFIVLYLNPKNFLFNNLNSTLIFSMIFISFIALLIIFPYQSFKSAQYGFNLWLNVVFPSLFPFFVASELLNGTGLIKAVGVLLEPIMRPLFNVPGIGSFALAMGISSGYPVGAKITTDFRKANLCTKSEAERLLAFTNNSSPLFITGAISTGILGHPEVGLILFGAHIAASFTIGVLFRFYKRNRKASYQNYSCNKGSNLIYRFIDKLNDTSLINAMSIGQKLGESIKNSINTLLMIGGFIVLFCVIINLLISLKLIYLLTFLLKVPLEWFNIDSNMATAVISGFFEITTGASYITHSVVPASSKIIGAAFIVGWGGLSVHAQVASIIAGTDISLKPYLVGKFMQGIFSAVYTYFLLLFSGLLKSPALEVFQGSYNYTDSWISYAEFSSLSASVIVGAAALLIIFIKLFRKAAFNLRIK